MIEGMYNLSSDINYELDDLTQIYNRKAFYVHTKELLNSQKNKEFFICAANVDKFKVINDLFGTRAGDELLKYIAVVISEYAKGYSEHVFGRMHADDFLLCLPYEDGCEEKISKYLDKKMEEYPLPLNIIIKCGIYHIHNMGIPVEIMCDRANMAIAQIKGKYSINFNVYDETLRKQILQEQEINSEMIQALNDNQFTPFYQPKYNMESGKVIGAEALVRWIHPQKGLVSPGIFIPIFEKNGFISKLDRYIWERVCADIHSWIKRDLAICPISVNVSRAELYDVNLPNILLELVEKYNIPIGLLQLEITESAYTDNPEQMIKAVENLKDAGFTILMDDFGSGYSSLNTLKDIPIDVLKLDLKFLYDMEGNKKADSILKSVVQMAKRLSLSVIAEGVENRTQVDYLKSVGCLRAQGYFYSKPIPRTDFEEMLKDYENVALIDEDYKEALINVDDIIGRYHREDEVEWYRSAVIMLRGMLFEYDVLRDTFTIFDMQMDEESNELQKVEIPNFISDDGFKRYTHPDDVELLINNINSTEGGTIELRMRSIGDYGAYRWFRITDHPIFNSEGEITSFVGVILNVSGNYQARALMSMMSVFAKTDMNLEEKLSECARIIYRSFNVDNLILDFPKKADKDEISSVSYDIDGKTTRLNNRVFDDQKLYDIHSISDEYNISVLPVEGDVTVPVYLAELDDTYTAMLSFVYEGRSRKLSDSDRRQMSEVSRCIFVNIEKSIKDKKDRQNLEMYANAFRSSRVLIREWNIQTKELYRSEAYSGKDGRSNHIFNAPYSLLEDGYVHPDFVEEYERVFIELEKGNDQILMVKVKGKNSCYEWMWCDYHVIFDAKGKPVKAVGTGEDINAIFETQQNMRRRLKDEKAIIPGAISWIDVDITDNVILASSGDIAEHTLENNVYSSLCEHIANHHVVETDQARYLENFSVENMEKLIISGQTILNMRYRMKHDDGTYEWRETSADLYQSRENGHFKAFAYVRNVDDQVKWQDYVDEKPQRNPQLHIYEKDYFEKLVNGVLKNDDCKKSALILVDMDSFSVIKENFSERYSDEIVRNIITIIRGTIGNGMALGKIYDDRFAIFVKDSESSRDMFLLINILKKRIYTAFHAGENDYVLSASIGMAYVEEVKEKTFAGLYEMAEELIIEEKNKTK